MGAAARGRADGAAPLIGSSAAIRAVRDRIERVAATDFTVLIEGAIGPQPHTSSIEISVEAPLGDRDRAAAGKMARSWPCGQAATGAGDSHDDAPTRTQRVSSLRDRCGH